MAYVPTYTSGDIAPLVFDLVGQFLAGITSQAAVIVLLIVVTIIIGLVVDLLTGVFGIVKFVRNFGHE